MSSTEDQPAAGAQRWRWLGTVGTNAGRPLANAMLATPFRLGGDRLRLYYGAVDEARVSRIRWLEVSLDRPTVVDRASARPVLDLGAPGFFDDNGVVPTGVVADGDMLRLFYAGFQRQTKIPYTMLTGMALSLDGGSTFRRVSTTPILERCPEEPFFRTAAWPLRDGDRWRLWYIGGGGWIGEGERLLPSYGLFTMDSADGLSWPGKGISCLSPHGDEIGFGRPCVERHGEGYRMWYAVRRRAGYHLGYAESQDGRHWRRRDDRLELHSPQRGFDDEMRCYPAVVHHGGKLFMFYNGNGYGRTGIGVATLDAE